jgi:hypothetical protein
MSSRSFAPVNFLVILSLLINLIPAPGVARGAAPHGPPETAGHGETGGPLPAPAAVAEPETDKPITWLPIFTLRAEPTRLSSAEASSQAAEALPPDHLDGKEPAASLTLYAERSTLIADGADTIHLVAFLADAQGRPVPDGTSVTWHSGGGARLTGRTRSREGLAWVTLQAEDLAEQVVVTASAGTAQEAITLTLTPPEAGLVQLDRRDPVRELNALRARARNTIRADENGRRFVDGPQH